MALPPTPPRPPKGGAVVPLSPPKPSGSEGAREAAEPSRSDGSTPLPPTVRGSREAERIAPEFVSPRLELDPLAAELISRAISAAISREMHVVRASLAPPPGDKPSGDKPASEPPRSSIRVAAGGAGKLGKWGTMAVGAFALIGQCIVWFARPDMEAPIAQAFKLLYLLFGGGGHAP